MMRSIFALLGTAVALPATLAAAPSATMCAAVTNPAPCGQPTDSEAMCLAKGCCFNASQTQTPCFYAGGNAVAIDTVHVVQACHFDAGFAKRTVDILNEYFMQYFPLAATLGAQLQALNGPWGLKFMTQSWIVSLYTDCPPNANLSCPSASELQTFRSAVSSGFITWHALPYNGELELMDPATLAAAINLTHSLDDAMGVPRKRVMSQRDVPGTTRSAIPLLLASGVEVISVGVNGASTPPNVPRAFIWRDPVSNTSIPAMWHPYGYGGIGLSDAVVLPGGSHALVFDWRGDNAGPPTSVQDVQSDWSSLNKTFPGAKIVASTLDDFIPYLQAAADMLPVITSEIGDTWVHGAQADIQKAKWTKRMIAARTACLESGACDVTDYAFNNFTRFLLKNTEHTFALDCKTWLHDSTNWTNADLQRVWNSSNFAYYMQSFQEQRNYGFVYALDALPSDHPLKPILQQCIDDVYPGPQPSPAAPTWTPITPGSLLQAGRFQFTMDPATGAFASLLDTKTQQVWANAANGELLGWLEYHTYDADDYTNFIDAYAAIQPPPSWFLLDFGKPNMSIANPEHQELVAQAQGMWTSADAAGTHVLEALAITNANGDEPHTKYGAPENVWVQYDFPSDPTDGRINITLSMYNKTATRLPEAMFFRFNASRIFGPKTSSPLSTVAWFADKLGQWVDPFDVVIGGNQHHHGVNSGFMATKSDPAHIQPNASVVFSSPDVLLSSFGRPFGLPTPTNVSSDPTQGAAFYLLDNLWGTNYVMWTPWAGPQDANILLRFQMSF